MPKTIVMLLVLCAVALTSGCASLTGTPGQSVTVETRNQNGDAVSDVTCKLANTKGNWYVKTPGSVMITRSNDDMQISCEKEGLPAGKASAVSATKGAMAGNIIFGGLVGAAIDHSSGAAYEYPALLRIMMGSVTKIGPPDLSQPNGIAPSAAVGRTTTTAAPSPGNPAPESPAVTPVATAPPSTGSPTDPRAAPDLADLNDLLPRK
jgi:hypothetical protein